MRTAFLSASEMYSIVGWNYEMVKRNLTEFNIA